MGPTKGRPKRGRLADLTIQPEEDLAYQPPPVSECWEMPDTCFVLREPGDEIIANCRIWIPRNKVCEFALTQRTLVDGEWVYVARIDTAHGTVHRHQYDRVTGRDRWNHRFLEKIPAVEGWEVVDRWYTEALRLMQHSD